MNEWMNEYPRMSQVEVQTKIFRSQYCVVPHSQNYGATVDCDG